MSSLRAIAPIILAIAILQAAGGLLNVVLPLDMSGDGLKASAIGAVGAAYSAGFMAGAWFGPRLLARSGHIRLFAACAALAAAATLAIHWADGIAGWALSRAAMGAAIALMFAAGESWMNSAISKTERGGVIGVYMVATKAAIAVGPFLAPGWPTGAPEPLMIAAALIALAMAPVCFTTTPAPPPPKPQPLALADLSRTAPAAVAAVFGAGLLNTAVLTLAPLYAREHYGAAAVAGFMSAAWIGSLILQYPAGRLSDRIDRRLVIAALTALPAAAALTLAVTGPGLAFWAAAIVFGVWGAGALSFYGIAVAHMADRAEPGQMARATSGLLFVWAFGSVLGPPLVGLLVEALGQSAMFWASGLGLGALTGLMLWRRQARAAAAPAEKEAFAPKQATSTAAAELAYGAGDSKTEN
jgi:MFS family permease